MIAVNRDFGGHAMKKALDIVLKVVLSLILVTPILGLTGLFPPPTQDLYNTPEAFAFIQMMAEGRYISIIMAVVHVVALVCLWTRRTGLAALLILPITVNVVAFHAFLDGGVLTAGAVLVARRARVRSAVDPNFVTGLARAFRVNTTVLVRDLR